MAEERLLVSLDWAIKKILRSKANFGVLEGFLSALLRYKVTIVEILESESNKDGENDKYNPVDIKVKNDKNEYIVIEIQFNDEIDYFQRKLFSVSRTICDHINSGNKYDKIVKVISVNIVYFDLGVGDDYIYHGTTVFQGVHNNDILKLELEQEGLPKSYPKKYFPEYYVIKVRKFNDIAKTPIDQWIYFLKNSRIKTEFNAEGIKEAAKTLDYLSLSKAERNAYDKHQDSRISIESMFAAAHRNGMHEGEVIGVAKGKAEGLVEGEAIGIAKGEKNKQIEIAQNLLNKGNPPEEVAEITGLTLEQINSIQAK